MQKQLSLQIENGTLAPPEGNTGAQSTGQRILLDWFAFTLPSFKELKDMFSLLGISDNEWVAIDTRAMNYKTMYMHGSTKVYVNAERQDMGIHCEMSGGACREYESFFGDRWKELAKCVRENNGHFTRIDLAIDDFDQIFTLDEIENKVKKAELTSFFRKGRRLEEYNLAERDYLGKTIYFGSPQSRIRVRMYDKAVEELIKNQSSLEATAIEKESKDKVSQAQMKLNKQLREDKYRQERLSRKGKWNRTEIQSRDERAEAIADYLQGDIEMGLIAQGILRNYINFVDPVATDSNKSRWPVSEFWLKFLGAVEKLKLTTEKRQRNIKQIKDWIIKQVAPSLALLSLNKEMQINLMPICEIAMFAMNRLKNRHLQLLQTT